MSDQAPDLTAFIQQASERDFWLGCVAVTILAALCLGVALRFLHRARLFADLPTSKVRSAAQGYVELQGRARMMPGEPVLAPLSGLPCVWYKFRVEERQIRADGRSREWQTLDHGISEAIFHLQDDSGLCVVDPDGAEITPSTRLCWRGHLPHPGAPPRDRGFWSRLLDSGPYRYTEYQIREYDPIYATGEFIGLGTHESTSIQEQTRDLLSAWKRDRGELLKRFDVNRDGDIDLEEWEAARRLAESTVLQSAPSPPPAELNVLRKPRHGRPFLLCCTTEQALIGRFRRRTVAALLAFFCLLAALGWGLDTRRHSTLSESAKQRGTDAFAG